MEKETNENYSENYDLLGINDVITENNETNTCTNITSNNDIENAFSDLISEYFEGETPIQNSENITTNPTTENSVQVDNINVQNQTTDGLLYTNLTTDTTVTAEEVTSSNVPTTNVYGVISTGETNLVNETVTSTVPTNGQTNVATETEFKLTQANLPAKIGFWTKVRNFFMSDSKIGYSVQEQTTNTGLWNKVQSFFSFGKNK